MSSHKKRHKEYIKKASKAVKDDSQRLAIDRTTSRFKENRDNALKELKNFEDLRLEARKIREKICDNLFENIKKFTLEFERVGGKVIKADDSAEATDFIIDLAKKKNIDLVVKSKSITTDEIDLNSKLDGAGIKVVETDLGEWIIQLKGQKPSHIIAPAIHVTCEEIAELFSKITGKKLPADPPALVEVARNELRNYFCNAGMGITGANFLISETGTIVLVSNEGNARLVSGFPPVHVAIAGIDKFITSMEEAAKLLKLLTISATGQKISTYVSFITGPSRTADIELNITLGAHGPKEVYLIVLDNGRRRIYEDKDFREALYCIRCGACLNVCPVYKEIGGHVFSHVYMGGIGAVLTAFLSGFENAREMAFSCTGCKACSEVCPVMIDIPRLLLKLRERIVHKEGLPWVKKIIFRKIMKDRKLFHKSVKALASAQKPFVSKTDGEPAIRHLPLLFSRLTKFRTLPPLADEPLRETLKKNLATVIKNPKFTVAFFAGCLIDFIYPNIGESILKVLADQNIETRFPFEQTCCGIPLVYSGDTQTAKEIALQNIEALKKYDFIITGCATCLEALRKEYPLLLNDNFELKAEAESLAGRAYDFSEFLVKVLNYKPDGKLKSKVTYHDSCHLHRGLEITEEPRDLLKGIEGLDFTEMEFPCHCCGAGGTFAFEYAEISEAILKRKLESIRKTKATIVATACPGCIMQIKGGLDKAGEKIKVKHIAEILNSSKNSGLSSKQ